MREPSAGRLTWWGVLVMALTVGALTAIALRSRPVAGPPSEDGTFTDGTFVSWLEQEVPRMMATDGIAGASILLLREGRPVWTGAYGVADRAEDRPFTTESIVMAHSLSKSVTAWGVLELVEEGHVDLDDPVTRYLEGWTFPESAFAADEVTIGRLLSNSAGVPLGSLGVEYAPGDTVPPLTETLTGDEVRLRRPPGSAFAYSNAGYGILELLVEEVTGRDFAEYMEAEVLHPLGMESSTFAWREDFRREIATGYDLGGDPVPPYVYPYRASGGLFSTLTDLGRFVAADMGRGFGPGRAVLSSASVAELHRPRVAVGGMFGVVADGYGLGHFVETLPSGEQAVWHGGQGHGWMTHFHAVPSTGDGIVILTNSQRSWPFMARILGEWSRAGGFGPVAFSRITTVVRGLWLVVLGLFLAAGVTGWRTLRRVRRRLREAPTTSPPTGAASARLAAALIGVTLLAGLGWALAQDYLFITSIFPAGSRWLALGILALGTALVLSAVAHPPGGISSRASGSGGVAKGDAA